MHQFQSQFRRQSQSWLQSVSLFRWQGKSMTYLQMFSLRLNSCETKPHCFDIKSIRLSNMRTRRSKSDDKISAGSIDLQCLETEIFRRIIFSFRNLTEIPKEKRTTLMPSIYSIFLSLSPPQSFSEAIVINAAMLTRSRHVLLLSVVLITSSHCCW